MNTALRTPAIAIASLLWLGAMSQTPYTVIVHGTVSGCSSSGSVNVQTWMFTQPPIDIDVPISFPDCQFSAALAVASIEGTLLISTSCMGADASVLLEYTINALTDTAYVLANFDCGGSAPINDECNAPTLLPMLDTCTPAPGDLVGATESFAPSNCDGFVSGTANDVWYAFVAASTSATIQADGDGDPSTGLDLVLEVYADSCAIASIDCSDQTLAGGLEEVTITTVPGTMYFYRLYPFTSPDLAVYTYTTCVFSDSDYVDCSGSPNGPNVQGSLCTYSPGLNGIWSADCDCELASCSISYTVAQATDSGGAAIPFQAAFLCMPDAQAPFTTVWSSQGNQTVSGNTFNLVLPGPGAFAVCVGLQSWAPAPCNTHYCDTVYADVNGFISLDPPVVDCEGMAGGSSMPGSPCDDGDLMTFNDIWSPACVCAGIVIPPCNACFTMDSNQPWQVELTNCTSGGSAPYTFAWSFSDGQVSIFQDPVWNVNIPGTYTACLTITDANACTSTTCDSLYVDVDGNVFTEGDCFGVWGGSALPGTPCDDGNTSTENDTWDADCNCIGDDGIDCQALLHLGAVLDGGAFVPWAVMAYDYAWGADPVTSSIDWGDGTADGANPHYYAVAGTYTVCLSMSDADGCTSLDCDTVSVDAGGGVSTGYAPCTPCVQPVQAVDGGGAAIPFTVVAVNCSTGGEDPITYLIEWGDGTSGLPGDTHTYPGPGWYIIGLHMYDGFGCQGSGQDMALYTFYIDPNGNVMDEPPSDCEAGFWVLQAYETDSLSGETVPIPNLLWVWNLSSGSTGTYQFEWSWGDGTPNSTDPYPTHVYANGGPYALCLTMWDGAGCTDTYCDSVSVNQDGIYEGMVLEEEANYARSGFTIQVRNQLPTGIREEPALGDLSLWPNPVSDAFNIGLRSSLSGNVRVSVIDINGRVVIEQPAMINRGENVLSIPVDQIQSGMYLVRLSSGTNVMNIRFVKN